MAGNASRETRVGFFSNLISFVKKHKILRRNDQTKDLTQPPTRSCFLFPPRLCRTSWYGFPFTGRLPRKPRHAACSALLTVAGQHPALKTSRSLNMCDTSLSNHLPLRRNTTRTMCMATEGVVSSPAGNPRRHGGFGGLNSPK